MKKSLKFAFLTLIIAIFFGCCLTTQAATKPTYLAELVARSNNGKIPLLVSDIIKMTSGKAVTLELKFKNTGTATWKNDGANLVALNLSEPYGRKSPFQHKWWRAKYAPCKLLEKTVKPGEIGTFRFAVAAPERPGTYVENYQLAVKGIDYLPTTNTQIFFQISNAKYKGTAATINIPLPVPPIVASTPASAEASAGTPAVSSSTSSTIPVDPLFNPLRFATKTLDQYAPIILPLNLTTTPVIATDITGVTASDISGIATAASDIKTLSKGPDIRIGIYSTKDPITIRANGPYEIRDENNTLLGNNLLGGPLTIKFDFTKKLYEVLENGQRLLLSDTPVRFAPKDETVIMEIPTNINTTNWKTYTHFRGTIEIAYTDDETLWIINELPFEDYLKGSGECGNNNPAGYLGAMAIAERTYAMTNWLNPSRHAKRGFVLTGNSSDQVYRGYDREQSQPKVAAAVNATNGLLVTYAGQVAVTPYSARTDGYTRTWKSVWGGSDKPWLQPKYVPFDQGKTMFGHGVGMSAWGAWDMAENLGLNWEEIVKYFYTGIELQKAY